MRLSKLLLALVVAPLLTAPLDADAGPRRQRPPPPPNAPAPPPMPVAVRHEEFFSTTPGAEFHIAFDTDPAGLTRFKVIQPEGFGVRISDATREWVRDTIPTSVEVTAGNFYRIEIYDSRRVFFDRRFEAQPGLVGTMRVPPPGGTLQAPVVVPPAPPPPVVIVTPPAPPPPPAPACTPDNELRDIARAMDRESFSDGKLGVLESAARDRWFCVDQVLRVLKDLTFGKDKLAALRVLAPRILDRQNNYKIPPAFTFGHEKEEAGRILR